jgi:AsmA protein
MKRSRIKWWTALAALLVIAALPLIPADLFRWRIQRALEQGLGRQVEIGAVHFTLLPGVMPGPGFTLDDVTIHEDPRAGIEPFVYVESLGASVRLLSLFSRRLEFSSLDLGDATINVVKTDAGPWNFQFLLTGASTNPRAMPSVRMRGGRVNFKFGDTKSVFYFSDADLNVAPSSGGSVELRFGGAPSRTDRSAQDFGRLYVRGNSTPGNQQMDFRVELERSSLEETLSWMIPGGLGVHGVVALEAQLSGPPTLLNVTGQLHIDDVHRWDLLPTKGGGWQLGFKGALDLANERLELASTLPEPAPALAVHFQAANWLSALVWDAAADVQEVPLATLLEIFRHMGAALPDKLSAEGKVSGSLRYSQPQGLEGRVELTEASLLMPGAAPLTAPEAAISVAGGALRLERTQVRAGERQSAEVEGTYSLNAPRELDLRISTRRLSVAGLRSFGLDAIPVAAETPRGTWRGAARYRSGAWSGEFDLQNARLPVPGIADPVEIQSATVRWNGKQVVISRLRATAGDIPFTGEYRWDPSADSPHRFSIAIAEADGVELARLLAPILDRAGGFLARTLHLGAPQDLPPWLQSGRAAGTISVESLALGDVQIHGAAARLEWGASQVHLTGMSAQLDSGTVAGDLEVDLTARLPRMHFDGKLQDVAYRGGVIDLEGTVEAEGGLPQLLDSARAEGRFRGRSISVAPDADFRTVTGSFETQGIGPQSRWRLSSVEVNQGGETYQGTGVSQPDGKLLLELAGRSRQLRYSATLFAPQAQP